MFKFLQKELEDYKILLRNIPSLTVSLFIISVIAMNLLSNKEISTGLNWLALDCGLLVSWLSFLTMDIVTKRFGARAAIKLSVLAVGINLLFCVLLFIISKIPGNWGQFYTFENEDINIALNKTFGGTWYIVIGSMIAFTVSSITNNTLNSFIGKVLRNDSFKTYAARTYISTAIGQFVDNFIFALIVSHQFFGWSMLQCITCSITGAVVELLCEVIFSPMGYKVCRKWEAENVGQSYIDAMKNGVN